MSLAELVYHSTRAFPQEERFGLTSQLRRAAVSVTANIAEGHGRTTRGEYGNSLSVARGSLKELETLSELANRLGYLDQSDYCDIQSIADEVSRMLTALKRKMVR